MKIHSILLQNLNSLSCSKPVTIQFNQPPLKDCGLFAITGPTGAGKTTILDALTLALYGETARESSEKEVMSQGTASCQAEVIFETASGACFQVRWALRRAHKKADGAFRPTEREFSEHPSGDILATKVAEVDALVQQHVGLSKEQFLQSVLLAQGKFTEFLQAKDGDRAELLEKITGTGIYRQLSKACFERQKSEAHKLELLQHETAGLTVLGEEEHENLLQQQAEAGEEAALLHVQLEQLNQEHHWHQELAELNSQTTAAHAQVQKVHLEKEAQAALYQRWEKHQKMLPLELPLQEWRNRRKALQETEAEAESKAAQLAAAAEALESAHRALEKQNDMQERAKQQLNREEPLLQEAIRHEKTLAEKKVAIEKAKQEKILAENKLSDTHKKLQAQMQLQRETREKGEALTAWLQQNKRDLELEAVAETAEAKKLNLETLRQEVSGIQKQMTAAQNRQQQHQKAIEAHQQAVAKSKETIAHCEEWFAKTAPEQSHWKYWLENQEQELRRRQTELSKTTESNRLQYHALEFYRNYHSRLKAGSPCDLCGSTVHPNAGKDLSGVEKEIQQKEEEYAGLQGLDFEVKNRLEKYGQMLVLLRDATAREGKLTPDENEAPETQLQYLNDQENEKKRLQIMLSAARTQAEQSESQLLAETSGYEKESTELQQLNARLTTLKADGGELFSWFEALSKSFGIGFIKGEEVALIATLRKRYSTYQNQVKAAETNAIEQGHQEVLAGNMRTDETTQIAALEQLVQAFQELTQQSEALENQIRKACPEGCASAAAYHSNLKEAVAEAEKARDSAQQLFNAAAQKHAGVESVLANLRQQISQRSKEQTEQHLLLQNQLKERQLPEDPEAAVQWLLSQHERQETARIIERIEQEEKEAQATVRRLQQELDVHLQAVAHVQPLAMVVEQKNGYSTRRETLLQSIGAITQTLEEDAKKRTLLSGKLAAVEAQQKEVDRWLALDDLIGSGSGDKFSKFAQTLSLEHLLDRANVHLRQLSNRYQLRRKTDRREELGIMVVDGDLGGSTREAGTLSGGETFLVSLGLALGLSDMASQNTPIDSLFIDEGFGSLDPDALQDALNTLENLQSRGKTIGIISHVEQLKERISTQIVVTKQGDGRSTLAVTML